MIGMLGAALATLALTCTVQTARAVTINYARTNAGLVYDTHSITQVVEGVTVTATGYTVEFDAGVSKVFGPFPTKKGRSDQRIFGPDDYDYLGLFSQPVDDIAVSGLDFGGQAFAPGFDNMPYFSDNPDVPGPPKLSLEFAVFAFSRPVDVSTVRVGGIFRRPIWVAGGAVNGLGGAEFEDVLAGMTVRNVPEAPGDGFATYNGLGMTDISYLFVGAPPSYEIGRVGPLTPVSNIAQFVIASISYEVSPVPEPAVAWQWLIGLVALAAFAPRLRRSAISGKPHLC